MENPFLDTRATSSAVDCFVLWDKVERIGYRRLTRLGDPFRPTIGEDSDYFPVYKVHELPTVFNDLKGTGDFSSMKLIPRSSQPGFVKEILSRNRNLPEDHENLIIPVMSNFVEMDSGELCIVMPFFSLRSLRGLPEACISVSLRYVLKALRFLHAAGAVHRDVSAGHVYLEEGPKIALGFAAATLYNLHSAAEFQYPPSSSLPATRISDWAAAPEEYNFGFQRENYSTKADVWLVGIVALELAYGEIAVQDRGALETKIRAITETRRLPKKLGPEVQQQRGASVTTTSRRSGVGMKRKAKMIETPAEEGGGEEEEEDQGLSSFSREFVELVAQCLAWNPEDRPCVDALLNHDFF
ncbi:unnamed protein product [Cuscuta campestris]|uniref:Protein kinase domain-containing protein n=1 Tax=Cuscuta campestris TaxID=132261 RepID=A0A484MCY6_9ASTE|nr:unnamed protein product [Cuscuta campestris]